MAVAEALVEIFPMQQHAPQVVEKFLLSNKKWGARDRHFIAEHIYESVRYYRLLCFATMVEKIETLADAWRLLAVLFIQKEIELTDWDEWKDIDAQVVKALLQKASAERKIRESIPDWLDQMGAAQMGETWETELHALNQPAKICLRVNPLRATKEKVKRSLEAEHIEFSEVNFAPDALVLSGRKNIRTLDMYREGEVEIQDVSSQLIAPMLRVERGMNVIDACAGAGGKSLHIAALMRNEGAIHAFDIHHNKLEELLKRSRRAGVSIITTHLPHPDFLKTMGNAADRILIDAPCSGLGTLRRNPGAKWKLTPDFVSDMQHAQQKILNQYAPLLKLNGILVYATCSILPIENEQQIELFLKKNAVFKKIEEKKILSCESGFDGFYGCALQRVS